MKTIEFLKNKATILSSAMTAGIGPLVPVFAATSGEAAEGSGGGDISNADYSKFNQNAGAVVKTIIGVLKQVVRWIGVVILAWGVISFIMGMRDEDVEKKHRATTLAIVGVAMVLVSFLVDPIVDMAMKLPTE